jgi:hypothetical protein
MELFPKWTPFNAPVGFVPHIFTYNQNINFAKFQPNIYIILNLLLILYMILDQLPARRAYNPEGGPSFQGWNKNKEGISKTD